MVLLHSNMKSKLLTKTMRQSSSRVIVMIIPMDFKTKCRWVLICIKFRIYFIVDIYFKRGETLK